MSFFHITKQPQFRWQEHCRTPLGDLLGSGWLADCIPWLNETGWPIAHHFLLLIAVVMESNNVFRGRGQH